MFFVFYQNILPVLTESKNVLEAAAKAKIQRRNAARYAQRVVDFIKGLCNLPRDRMVSLSGATLTVCTA